MQRFGEKLRTLRKRSGMTQHDLAAWLGFASQGYIHFLETDKKLPNAVLIIKIADLFQVTTDQLLRDELELDTEAGSQLPTIISLNPVEEKGTPMLRLRVRTVAEGKGYTIQRLHDESGVSYDTVLKYWHNQVRRIDTATLAALAKALQTTSIELLEEVSE